MTLDSGVDSRGAGGARAPPEFWGSEKGQSLISAYRSLAITYSKHLWIWKAIYGTAYYAGITKKNIFGTIF